MERGDAYLQLSFKCDKRLWAYWARILPQVGYPEFNLTTEVLIDDAVSFACYCLDEFEDFPDEPAAYSTATGSWSTLRPRPLCLFPPEPIAASGTRPPAQFRWRRMSLTTGRATGPERIAPEWWLPDDNWRSGVRDYWKVDTTQGRRLWLFYTPQNPNWFVQGEFP